MSITVSMRDIAEAAGVSKAAVSRVINGRPAGIRISSQTRNRILSVVRQTGYQPDRFVREMANPRQPTIGLILAPGGPDASAAHLAAAEAVIAAAGYQLRLIILPVDPVAAKDRVKALLQDGVASLLCAPAAMAIAIQTVSGTCPELSRTGCPVVALGRGSGEALLKAFGVEVSESRVESPASKVESTPQAPAPVSTPPTTPAPVSVSISLEGGNAPLSLVEGPLPPPPQPVSEPVVTPPPVLDTEPAIPVPPAPDVVSEPPQDPVPVFTPPIIPASVSEPVPPLPAPVSEPVAPPSPVLDTEPAIPVVPTPAVVSEPPQAPIQVFTPPTTPEPEPVSEPIPLEGGNPLPPLPDPVSEPVVTPPPVLAPAPIPPAPEPAIIEPVPVIPDPPPASEIHSTTQQPDNSTTAPPASLATETSEPEVNLDDAHNIQ